MEFEKLLDKVRNDRIAFVTERPPGSRFAMLERRVKVTGPPEAVQIAESGDVRALDSLLPLLRDPQRNWAAEVLLAAMTRHEEDVVNTYQANPDGWQTTLGPGAYERWSRWLDQARGRLAWDPEQQAFVEKP